jgi:hypothetical protein
MFADEIRAAVMAAPRVKLPEVAAVLWRAYDAGQVSEAQAEELSALIEARKVVPAKPTAPKKSVGSRPKTDASLERRRRWAASGRLPPALAARFTPGEIAVLAVVAAEVSQRRDCRLAVGRLAALAGVSETLVRNALREARALGLITVDERRISAWRNDTNVVRIVSTEWSSWLRLARGASAGATRREDTARRPAREPASAGLGGGCRSVQGTSTITNNRWERAGWKTESEARGEGKDRR